MLKSLNVKVNGSIEGNHNNVGFNSDTTDNNLSSDTLAKINALINQIQGDGYVEIHIEQNGLQSFVHKRGATVIDSEDNVNAYELFEDMSWVSELVEEEGQPEFP